jgi:hypothetical protein
MDLGDGTAHTLMPIAKDIPQTVTRFYGTVDYAIDVITNRRIAFVHISVLNDPFDPYCFFETDFGDSYHNLLAYVRKNHPTGMPWFRAHVTPQSWGQIVQDLKAYMKRVRDTSFILSTSAEDSSCHPKDNLYMWGHYGAGHRGLAFEFNTQALANAALKHHEDQNGKPPQETEVWAKIDYTNIFGPITAEYVYEFMKQEHDLLKRKAVVRSDTRLDVYYRQLPKIKSDVWQRENEWRLMWHNDQTKEKVYKCPIGEDSITSIFLGLNLDSDKAREIVTAAKHNFPNASILQAYKQHGALALEFRGLRARS